MTTRTMDKEAVYFRTRASASSMRDFIRRAKEMENETSGNAAVRISSLECKTCWYVRRGALVGQAFTGYTCDGCKEVFSHHNTGVPKLCVECALEFGLCRRCGGDIEGVERPRGLDGHVLGAAVEPKPPKMERVMCPVTRPVPGSETGMVYPCHHSLPCPVHHDGLPPSSDALLADKFFKQGKDELDDERG